MCRGYATEGSQSGGDGHERRDVWEKDLEAGNRVATEGEFESRFDRRSEPRRPVGNGPHAGPRPGGRVRVPGGDGRSGCGTGRKDAESRMDWNRNGDTRRGNTRRIKGGGKFLSYLFGLRFDVYSILRSKHFTDLISFKCLCLRHQRSLPLRSASTRRAQVTHLKVRPHYLPTTFTHHHYRRVATLR